MTVLSKLRATYSGAPREIKNKLNQTILATQKKNVISGSGATVTLTKEQSGSIVLFDKAYGIVFTLPTPVVGLTYDFIVTTTITSNAAKIITDGAATFMGGTILAGLEATTPAANPGPKLFSGNGTSHTYLSSNGSTTGGIIGSRYTITCVDSTRWEISGISLCTGTIATPFA